MRHESLVFVATGLFMLALNTACERKNQALIQQTQEASKTADERVAALERELTELKKAKQQQEQSSADKEAAAELAEAQKKALERQLAEAKRKAEQKKQEAKDAEKKPAPPKETPQPIVVEVPAETKIEAALNQELATDKVQAGDVWEGSLAKDLLLDGKVVWPKGTRLKGVVTQSVPAGRLQSGQGGLGIRLTEVAENLVDASTYLVVGDKRGERNAKVIGGGAALGALVGILSDKKNKNDHALGGAALGAAAGTAIAAATAETVIRIGNGQPITFTLTKPEKVVLKP